MAKSKAQKVETKVADSLEMLSQRRNFLEVDLSEKPRWATSCRLDMPGWPSINIQVAKEMALLAHAAGNLGRLNEDLVAMSVEPLWDGYLIKDWQSDLRCRVNALRSANELDKVKALEARVNPMLTEDQKRDKDLAGVLREMSKLGM